MMEEEMMNEPTICETSQYEENLYNDVEKTTVTYGSAIGSSGFLQYLKMDIYNALDDTTTNKPVMILAFGGAFITGERGDMEGFARLFAQKGYVSAAIDYRLLSLNGGIPDSVSGLEAAVKASFDMKAAIRHFRKEAANGNPYNIDESKIFIGGVSAGAIAALNAAMLDEEDVTEPHVLQVINDNGGFEGNSGDAENLSYSSEVAGVFNMSGAVYRLSYINDDDPPIYSVHGDMDEVVPYEYDFVRLFGIEIIPLYGSKSIHDYASSIGLRSELLTVVGGDHSSIYTSNDYAIEQAAAEMQSAAFFKAEVCK
jgi:predicted esterase